MSLFNLYSFVSWRLLASFFSFAAAAAVSAVDTPSGLPTVSLVARRAETSEPSELARIAPGEFLLTRNEPMDRELSVLVTYGGNATPGVDYSALEKLVIFPAGTGEVSVFVGPYEDSIAEGDETVVASLTASPTAALPTYLIDPVKNTAKVVIHDNDSPRSARITITHPLDGSEIPAGTDVEVNAETIDPDGYIPQVEFYLDGTLLDISTINFFRAPDPGTPIEHSIVWKNPSAGQHTLIAQGRDAHGTIVSSAPVRVTVGANTPSSATIEITSPQDGETFAAVKELSLAALAIDPKGYIPRVEFFANGRTIGVSEVAFLRAPDPGTPIKHGIIWANPQPGDYLLTAQGVDSEGKVVISKAVHITIQNVAPAGARLEITSPTDGQSFAPGADIPITAVAIDPQGYIARVEFYANDQFIGVSQIYFIRAPDPGTPITHTVIWTNAPAGKYTLTARVPEGYEPKLISPPVTINVAGDGEVPPGPDGQVVLGVEAVDAVAAESSENGTPDSAVFIITRIAGRNDIDVPVFFELSGTAENGVDYGKLEDHALIPAGADQLKIVVQPIPDKALEADESVVLTLLEPVCPAIFPPPPQCYAVGNERSAKLIIQELASAGESRPPVTIDQPRDGSVFQPGDTIEIKSSVSTETDAQRLEILVDGQSVATAQGRECSFQWTNAPEGSHLLVARLLTPQSGARDSAPIKILVEKAVVGEVVFDGKGSTEPGSEPPRLPGVQVTSDGLIHLKLAALPGQVCVLESSADLLTWSFAAEVFVHDGELDYAIDKGESARRYYRLRSR